MMTGHPILKLAIILSLGFIVASIVCSSNLTCNMLDTLVLTIVIPYHYGLKYSFRREILSKIS